MPCRFWFKIFTFWKKKRVIKKITKLQEETADAVQLVLETVIGKVRFDEKVYPIREKPDILMH